MKSVDRDEYAAVGVRRNKKRRILDCLRNFELFFSLLQLHILPLIFSLLQPSDSGGGMVALFRAMYTAGEIMVTGAREYIYFITLWDERRKKMEREDNRLIPCGAATKGNTQSNDEK